jgi:hypothetical protein
MNREIKFRGKRINNGEWVYGSLFYETKYTIGSDITFIITDFTPHGFVKFHVDPDSIGQLIGLKDKNGNNTCIYEGDIVSLHGTLIGNKYENPDLLKDKTNLLIEGLGTKTWTKTEQEGLGRGLFYSE